MVWFDPEAESFKAEAALAWVAWELAQASVWSAEQRASMQEFHAATTDALDDAGRDLLAHWLEVFRPAPPLRHGWRDWQAAG